MVKIFVVEIKEINQMSVLMILVIIGLLILWFLLSPFFTKIGSFVYKIIKNSVIEEINKDEKETKE